MLPNLQYNEDKPTYLGIPIDDIKAFNTETLTEFKVNENASRQLQAFAKSIDPIKNGIDDTYLNDQILNIDSNIKRLSEQKAFHLLGNDVKDMVHNFSTDKTINNIMTSKQVLAKAAEDYNKTNNDQEIKDLALKYTLDNYNRNGGAVKGVLAPINLPSAEDFDKNLNEILKSFKADKFTEVNKILKEIEADQKLGNDPALKAFYVKGKASIESVNETDVLTAAKALLKNDPKYTNWIKTVSMLKTYNAGLTNVTKDSPDFNEKYNGIVNTLVSKYDPNDRIFKAMLGKNQNEAIKRSDIENYVKSEIDANLSLGNSLADIYQSMIINEDMDSRSRTQANIHGYSKIDNDYDLITNPYFDKEALKNKNFNLTYTQGAAVTGANFKELMKSEDTLKLDIAKKEGILKGLSSDHPRYKQISSELSASRSQLESIKDLRKNAISVLKSNGDIYELKGGATRNLNEYIDNVNKLVNRYNLDLNIKSEIDKALEFGDLSETKIKEISKLVNSKFVESFKDKPGLRKAYDLTGLDDLDMNLREAFTAINYNIGEYLDANPQSSNLVTIYTDQPEINKAMDSLKPAFMPNTGAYMIVGNSEFAGRDASDKEFNEKIADAKNVTIYPTFGDYYRANGNMKFRAEWRDKDGTLLANEVVELNNSSLPTGTLQQLHQAMLQNDNLIASYQYADVLPIFDANFAAGLLQSDGKPLGQALSEINFDSYTTNQSIIIPVSGVDRYRSAKLNKTVMSDIKLIITPDYNNSGQKIYKASITDLEGNDIPNPHINYNYGSPFEILADLSKIYGINLNK